MSRLTKYIVIAACVAVGVVLSLFITKDVNANTLLTLVDGQSDFSISDFYNRVDANRDEKTVDPNVVVVNIDSVTDRADMAELLQRIYRCRPRVVGVDAVFAHPRTPEDDSLLLRTLSAHSANVVLSSSLAEDGASVNPDLVAERLPGACRGVANLVSKGRRGVVRTYRPAYVLDGDTVPSLALSMCRKMGAASPVTTDLEHIYYSSNEILVLQPDDVVRNADLLRGKAVLVGTIGEAADLHATPLSAEYPGVLIHANILSNMLGGDYLTVVDDLINWTLGILISVLMGFFYFAMSGRKSKPVAIRLALLLVVAVGIWIGCWVYSAFHVSLGVPKILLVVALGQLSLDLYCAADELLHSNIVKKIRKK